MLAVKAKYEDGTVRWEQKPPVEGVHDLIVVFADVSASDQTEQGAGPADVHDNSDESRIWTDLCLANLESAYWKGHGFEGLSRSKRDAGETVIERSDIVRVARQIGEVAKAERVVLFGSVSFVSQALREGETVYAR